jgi:hypothetical protein
MVGLCRSTGVQLGFWPPSWLGPGRAGRGWPGVACVRHRRSVRVGWSGRRRKSVLVRQENMRLGKSMVLFGSAAVGQSQSQSSDSVIIIKVSH